MLYTTVAVAFFFLKNLRLLELIIAVAKKSYKITTQSKIAHYIDLLCLFTAERKDAIFNSERQIEEARELVSLLI
jgi:hypothetical protein